MELHWRDVKDQKDEWGYLEVDVKEDVKPTLRLHSGGDRRFKLVNQNHSVFWGKMEIDYQGAWFLRNDNEWQLEDMPIPPITSQIVQSTDSLSGDGLTAFWCRHFAKELSNSEASPLYEGKWRLTSKSSYIEMAEHALAGDTYQLENRYGFYQKRPLWVDWGISGSYILLALKAIPEAKSSRVKWWRKVIRTSQCPPVLIWYIQSLSAYIILDGHSRLRACQLENHTPTFITLSSVIEHQAEFDKPRAKAVYKNLEERQKHPWKNPLNVDEINTLLVKIYDNTPFTQEINRAKASAALSKEWLNEVSQFSGLDDTDELALQDLMSTEY